MSGIIEKMLGWIGIDSTDLEEGYEDETYEDDGYDKVVDTVERSKPKKTAPTPVSSHSNVVDFPKTNTNPTAAQLKMIVYNPISYEDTQNIIDNLKSRKPVIVNMEELELDCAQRILDFMAGAIYAINGTIYKISRGIFVVAPTNYDVIGNDEGDYDGII